jgi:hypothetical protein
MFKLSIMRRTLFNVLNLSFIRLVLRYNNLFLIIKTQFENLLFFIIFLVAFHKPKLRMFLKDNIISEFSLINLNKYKNNSLNGRSFAEDFLVATIIVRFLRACINNYTVIRITIYMSIKIVVQVNILGNHKLYIAFFITLLHFKFMIILFILTKMIPNKINFSIIYYTSI